jgi:simple sugar transport system permease protein
MILAGAFAGLAGSVEVLGVFHRMVDGLSGGNGFTAIVVALFGGLHPIGAVPASILFGSLIVGGDKMQRMTQTPTALIDSILGLVVLFVVASQIWSRRQAQRRELYE